LSLEVRKFFCRTASCPRKIFTERLPDLVQPSARMTNRLRSSPPIPKVRVLGLDDWAYKRGDTYGTILVDLERHWVIDLLPAKPEQVSSPMS
jgi:hypothetical protein